MIPGPEQKIYSESDFKARLLKEVDLIRLWIPKFVANPKVTVQVLVRFRTPAEFLARQNGQVSRAEGEHTTSPARAGSAVASWFRPPKTKWIQK